MFGRQQDDMDYAGKRFLVVDDFQGMRGTMRDILRACGANQKSIEVAANGSEAIRYLQQGKFDVVLCDFNLGSGKNGQQVLEEAKFRELIGPACAWIMITAEKTADAVTGTAEYQPDAYLIKPITEAALRTRLARVWKKKEAFSEVNKALARRDTSRAIHLCEERATVDKANAAELQRLKCQLLMASGDLEQARQGYAQVLAVRDTPWAKLGMAKIHYQNNEFDNARKLLEETVRDNRAYLEAYDFLAKTLQEMGDMEASEEVIERATKLSPNSVVRQKARGDLAVKLGKLDEAEQAYRKSVTLGEHSVLKTPDTYIGLAKVCSAKDNPKEALSVLGNLNKTFDSEDVLMKSKAVEGQVHIDSGNMSDAKKVAEELGRLIEDNTIQAESDTAIEMARFLLATDASDSAMTLLRREVQNNPDNAALLEEVQGIFDAADMSEAGEHLVETSRQEAIEMMNRGVLLLREGKLEETVVWMRNAHETMPRNIRVLFNFIHVLVSKLQKDGVDMELVGEARKCLELAGQLSPGDSRVKSQTENLNNLVGA